MRVGSRDGSDAVPVREVPEDRREQRVPGHPHATLRNAYTGRACRLDGDHLRAFCRLRVRAHRSVTFMPHTISIDERTWPDEVVAQARCDCGWEGPRRSQAHANLLAQQDAWDHVERAQRAVNARRFVSAA